MICAVGFCLESPNCELHESSAHVIDGHDDNLQYHSPENVDVSLDNANKSEGHRTCNCRVPYINEMLIHKL